MKDHHRRRDVVSWSRFFWCMLVFFSYVLLTSFFFSTFRLFFGGTFRPKIVSTWRFQSLDAISGELPENLAVRIRETVMLPDHVLIFLKYPHPARFFTKEDLECLYFAANSSRPQLKQPPNQIDGEDLDDRIVRCPRSPRGFSVALKLKQDGYIQPGPTYRWDSLVYEALIDRDNTTIVFVKGLNLRPYKLYNASGFECLYGWDFIRPKFLLRSNVISIAQEIVRCKTPWSILTTPHKVSNSIKVSVRVKGSRTLPSIARLGLRWKPKPKPEPGQTSRKTHELCICTMLRNQARFLKEWVMYHAQIGVERWFIYDNNSEDNIINVIDSLLDTKLNISRHTWPWVKTQEAGFAHCALRARDVCEWVGFIDVDEFFHLPTNLTMPAVLRNQSNKVGEVRVWCHSFGPSGLKTIPPQGVMVGYTCRLLSPERHKSIVRPEAMNSTLINVVHHFHLRDDYSFVNANREVLIVNHYKYQVWEVFKEKFYRRVATYVSDWQNEVNVGSKDRAPGLGTRPVEPPDWSSRFCEVRDTGLRDRVLRKLTQPGTNLLLWQEGAAQ